MTDQPIATGEISFLGSWGVPGEYCTGPGTGTSTAVLMGGDPPRLIEQVFFSFPGKSLDYASRVKAPSYGIPVLCDSSAILAQWERQRATFQERGYGMVSTRIQVQYPIFLPIL